MGIYQTMKLKQECSSWRRFEAQCFQKKGIMLYKCTQMYLYFGPFLLIVCAWHPNLPPPHPHPPQKIIKEIAASKKFDLFQVDL